MSTDVVNNEPVGNEIRRLFAAEARYFEYTNTGAITQADLAPDRAHEALTANLKSAGFDDLPYPYNIAPEPGSTIQGYQRSDDVIRFHEKKRDGSDRGYDFFTTHGPENISVSFSLLDMLRGQTTDGILTKDGRLFLKVTTNKGDIFYIQMQKYKRSS